MTFLFDKTRLGAVAAAVVVAPVLLAIAAPAQAVLTTYTTQAAFAAATAAFSSGVDTFSNVPLDAVSSPAVRSAGSFGYTVSAPGGLYGTGTSADPWLSTNYAGEVLTFTGFAAGSRAIGGLFFASDLTGAFLSGQTLVLTATDSLGARSILTIANATQTSFAGYLTNGTLVSMTVEVGARDAYGTVNNLVLAQPVPEPQTYALLLAGLAVVGGMARRRRQRP